MLVNPVFLFFSLCLPRRVALLGSLIVTHRVSHRGLQGRVLFLLAADVVKSEEDVVVVRQGGRQLDLDLIMKVRGPVDSSFNNIIKLLKTLLQAAL